MDRETLCTIALSQVKGLGNNALTIYQKAGSAAAIVDNRHDLCSVVGDCNVKIAKLVDNGLDAAMERAKREADFIDTHAMKALPFNARAYPERLRNCLDAPLLLYYSGNADLNAKHIISVVGTRHCTNYGRDICRELIADVAEMVPNCLIVSGLAYGVDICAHTNALENGLNTIGVLAHGLEKIYPQVHRSAAVRMTQQGGLITEYITNSVIEKTNFLKRNRIIAGMCDAAVIVESAERGGSLFTAKLANDYNRDVFTFPGRIHDEMSKGCNRLIRINMAMAITSAKDLVSAMNWQPRAVTEHQTIQTELFHTLTETELKIVNLLKQNECLSISEITRSSELGQNIVTSILFDMEMKGIVAAAGAMRYRLLRHDL